MITCCLVCVAGLLLTSTLAQLDSGDSFYFSYDVMQTQLDVVEGSGVTLRCDVSDRRHVFFQWTLGGRPVRNTSRRFQEDSNLRIQRVMRGEDEGGFQCTATNATTRFSLQSLEAHINIQWIDPRADVELRRPRRQEVTSGVDIILKCVISGNPDPTILWYHNKFRLFNQDKVRILDEGNRIKLLNMSAGDNGVYSCRAENVAGAVDSTNNFLLNIQVPGSPRLVESQFTPYLVAQRGSPARLDCPFVGASRIDWFSNYLKLSNTSRHVVYPNGSLFFPKVRAADQNSYRCEGLSHAGPSPTFTAELFLASLEELHGDNFEPRLLPNYPVVIPAHQPFTVQVFLPRARPKPNYWWLGRSGRVVPPRGAIHVKEQSLVFQNPQQIDSGNYTFILNNTAGRTERSIWVMVSVPPAISRAPQPMSVQEDRDVSLSCQVEGTTFPVTTVTWRKDGTPLPLFSPRFEQDLESGVLVIRGAQMSDMGQYACVANTSGHPLLVSDTALLTVTKRLKFWPEPEDSQLELGVEGSVTCHAEAETPPTVRWLKQGSPSLPPRVSQQFNRLVFSPARRDHAGHYTCRASHPRQGDIAATILVHIVELPTLRVKPSNVTVLEGQPALLHCMADGFPAPLISWYRGSQPILPDARRYTMFKNGSMHIHQVYLQDNGMYACVANNSAGTVRWDFSLMVTDERLTAGEEDFNMVKTIIIAVCSAGAYLALVIGLTAFCSYRLLTRCRSRKALSHPLPLKGESVELQREQHELLMKEPDSCAQFRSDSDNRSHAGSNMSSHPSHSSHSQQSRSRRPSLDRFHFPRHTLNTLGIMGKGSYGDVFLATVKAGRAGDSDVMVVVKSLLSKTERDARDFCAEMDLFARVDHPNVVHFVGACREVEPHFLITEYCDWGDLKQFLLATRTDNGRSGTRVPPLTLGQKTGFAQQVCCGMEALWKQGLVHGDLASRNVLLTSRMVLKVARPALSGDVYASEYYPLHKRLVPLRWLAPEGAQEEEEEAAGPAGDVWAFGVLLWEVLHLADLPYRLMSDQEVLRALQQGQATLELGDLHAPVLTSLLRHCTAPVPEQRPTFSELHAMLSMAATDVV